MSIDDATTAAWNGAAADEQLELLAFSHAPIRAPRSDVIGEVVMSETWCELMQAPTANMMDECDEYAFRAVMSGFPNGLTQRHATVAASFINWLGTNCGRGLLHDATRLRDKFTSVSQAYTAAWAIDNTRHRWLNGGVRAIEAALAPTDHWHNGALKRLPELSADDYEVVEHVVIWLSMPEGQAYLANCETEITRRLDDERAQRVREFALERHKRVGNKRDQWR